MRKAYNNFGLINDNNQIIGVSLGYDHCAEHEWGIKKLKDLFGIPEPSKKNLGVIGRTITKCDDDALVLLEEKHKRKNFAILYTKNLYSDGIPYDLKNYKKDILWYIESDEKRNTEPEEKKDALVTAWDGSSFGIGVMGDNEIVFLRELYQAFLDKNVVIAFTKVPNNPFAGTSLCIFIKDRIPEEVSDLMYSADKEYYDREDYEEKIGMKKIIAKHGNKNGYKEKKYFVACSPKWICYGDEKKREEQKKINKTKYDILYWVNYSDDDDNWGYYTVEEIREWLTGDKKLTEVAPRKKKK